MKTTTTKKTTKTTDKAKKAPLYTVADLMASIKTGGEQLQAEIKSGKSARYQEYLKFASSFHKYSANNTLLILLGCQSRNLPDPQHVASFNDWKDLGFSVIAGSKGLPILYPCTKKLTSEDDDKIAEGDVKVVSFFRVGYVFTNDQVKPVVEGASFPRFFPEISGNADDLCETLLAVVHADGIKVSTVPIPGGTRGRSFGGRIELDDELDSVSRLLVLAHEYAHEKLHHDGIQRTKQVVECHAEAVAYVVANALGIHNPYSADYLQNWGNDEKTFLKELKVINNTAHDILVKMREQMGEVVEVTEVAA